MSKKRVSRTCFGRKWQHYETLNANELGNLLMSNGQFDDVGVLTTLERLRQNGLLSDNDLEILKQQLKTDWGREAFAAWHNQDKADFQPARSVLQRFSNAFN